MASGFRIGSFAVCWRDDWTGACGIEISWGQRAFVRGFNLKEEITLYDRDDWNTAWEQHKEDSMTYRDATISKTTRDNLWKLHDSMLGHRTLTEPQAVTYLEALADVIRRWDGNEATEIKMQENGTWAA